MILVQRNRLKANMTNTGVLRSIDSIILLKWVKSGFPIILFKNTHNFSSSQKDRIGPRRAAENYTIKSKGKEEVHILNPVPVCDDKQMRNPK